MQTVCRWRLIFCPFLLLAACEAPDDDLGHEAEPASSPRKAWSPDDRPSLLAPDFVYVLDDLPTAGTAKHTPWPGPYWPTYLDGINLRWAGPGVPSPAEKYGLAFAKPGLEDAISYYYGVDSVGGEPCTTHTDCDLALGYACGKRRGEAKGVCVESWFGICHAWAPAAVLEPEPTQPVVYGGVEFKVNDLKALISLAYTDDLDVRFVSLRCDDKGEAGDGKPQCEDTNAGTFHVAVANLLGLRREAFIEDRTYDYQVWNEPVFAFKVNKLEPLTGQQANLLLGAGDVVYSTAKHGKAPANQLTQLGGVAVAPGQTLRVRTTGTGDVDLYVRWNTAPGVGAFHCRPFIVGSNELCEMLVPAAATGAFFAVYAYGTAADYKLTVELREGAPAAYAFNPKAKALRRVQTALSYVGSSPPDIDGPLTGKPEYTFTDVYDYVLELDGAGKIIGGEWLGSSKVNHPDFLWRPMKKLPGTVAGGKVSWANVQKLLAGGGGAP